MIYIMIYIYIIKVLFTDDSHFSYMNDVIFSYMYDFMYGYTLFTNIIGNQFRHLAFPKTSVKHMYTYRITVSVKNNIYIYIYMCLWIVNDPTYAWIIVDSKQVDWISICRLQVCFFFWRPIWKKTIVFGEMFD